jgi:hypothetical protein
MQSTKIKKRIFLVGCSRSGTTLLQRLIAGHPRIHSFPETQFFRASITFWRQPLVWLGFSTGRESMVLDNFLIKINRNDLNAHLKDSSLFFRNSVDNFIYVLHRLTLEEGKNAWIEKSPKHFYYIDIIKKYISDVHIIHIIRDGRSVVASIYDRAMKYDNFRTQRHLKYGIDLWNDAIKKSISYFNIFGHTFVLYEHLIKKPEIVLKKICDDLGIAYSSKMLYNTNVASKIILPDQEWVQSAAEYPKQNPSKFKRLFDNETQALISKSLQLKYYKEIKESINYL